QNHQRVDAPLRVKLEPREVRTESQLKEHYRIEKELAERLRSARPEARGPLYGVVYSELFERVPSHPQLTRVERAGEVDEIVAEKLSLLGRYITPKSVFLEVGAGDCRLSLAVAKRANKVYALDVSDGASQGVRFPDNVEFVLSRGTDIPVP